VGIKRKNRSKNQSLGNKNTGLTGVHNPSGYNVGLRKGASGKQNEAEPKRERGIKEGDLHQRAQPVPVASQWSSGKKGKAQRGPSGLKAEK